MNPVSAVAVTAPMTLRADLRDMHARRGVTHRTLRFSFFGAFAGELDGAAMPRLRSRKGVWLLALLALRNGREVSREWLTTMLWPDATEAAGSVSLRQSLADLRRALGPHAERIEAPSPRSLRVDLSAEEADLVAFDQAVRRTDPEAAAVAAAAYSGPLLEGCTEEWVGQERDVREQAYLDALQRLADHCAEVGDLPGSIAYLRRMAGADPLSETARRALMQALARGGDYAGALAAYRDLRILLRREMNSDPAPETVDLFEAVRLEARTRASARPALILELEPPLAATGRLPAPLTQLIGREAEARRVAVALEEARLVTLAGPGGVGKTRLALHVARELGSAFPDGVWLVDLSAIAPSGQVCRAAAAALGLAETPGEPCLDALKRILGPRRLLMVLDNCEHVHDQAGRMAALLLTSCPDLRLLATSRQPLSVVGESVYQLPALAMPPDGGAPEPFTAAGLMEYPAVRLFVERARGVRSDFALTEKSAPAVAAIVRRLDGNPLALELAAARVRAMPVEQIAQRLGDAFHLLVSNSPGAPQRHQALGAAIGWSHDTLTTGERALFRRLAVFGGGWTLPAAEEVCALDEGDPEIEETPIVDLLSALVDKSMVVFDPSSGEEGRYRMLETVRQYAVERLAESGEEDAARRRHLCFYAAAAHRTSADDQGSRREWIEAMDGERDNLRGALDYAEARGLADEALSLSSDLVVYWWARRAAGEGAIRLNRALALAEGQAPSDLRVAAMLRSAEFAWLAGDAAETDRLSTQGLSMAEELGNAAHRAWAQVLRGHTELERGAADAADEQYGSARAYFQSVGDEGQVAATDLYAGEAARLRGDLERARSDYEAGRGRALAAGQRRVAALCAHNLGAMALDRQETGEALRLLRHALAEILNTPNTNMVPMMLPTFAGAALALGDPAAAVRLLAASVALHIQNGTVPQAADRAQHAQICAGAEAACAALGLEADREAGRGMTFDEAVALALALHPNGQNDLCA